MMRTWFWRCAAAGAVAAAGASAAVYYAYKHPDSYLGRCFGTAASGWVLFNPINGVGRAAGEEELAGVDGQADHHEHPEQHDHEQHDRLAALAIVARPEARRRAHRWITSIEPPRSVIWNAPPVR